VTAALYERGLTAQFIRNDPHDRQGRSGFTRDVNGFAIQLDPRDLTTRPAPVASPALLKVAGLNHIRTATYSWSSGAIRIRMPCRS
jgi:hypothetical protein